MVKIEGKSTFEIAKATFVSSFKKLSPFLFNLGISDIWNVPLNLLCKLSAILLCREAESILNYKISI